MTSSFTDEDATDLTESRRLGMKHLIAGNPPDSQSVAKRNICGVLDKLLKFIPVRSTQFRMLQGRRKLHTKSD
jgi:hypothetical protein